MPSSFWKALAIEAIFDPSPCTRKSSAQLLRDSLLWRWLLTISSKECFSLVTASSLDWSWVATMTAFTSLRCRSYGRPRPPRGDPRRSAAHSAEDLGRHGRGPEAVTSTDEEDRQMKAAVLYEP